MAKAKCDYCDTLICRSCENASNLTNIADSLRRIAEALEIRG